MKVVEGKLTTTWRVNNRPEFGGGTSLDVELLESLWSVVSRGATTETAPVLGEAERIALGSMLFRLLVPNDQVSLEFSRILREWAGDGRSLRLALILGDPDLEGLPWELLRDPER
ncbi:MAG: hypothetical protein ACRD6W_05835, partial [Nitrososphaerales archaeon]